MEGPGGEPGDLSATLPVVSWRRNAAVKYRHYLDRSVPYIWRRWLGTLVVATIYVLRVYCVKGFSLVSYGLATYVLNMVIGFLSPMVDPELDGVSVSTRQSDESKPPFIRRLPEFKFWYTVTKAFVVALFLTFISLLDVPVFWPILLFYWCFLLIVTMKRQITHMIRYKYNPFRSQRPRTDSSSTETRSGVSRD